MRILDSYNTHIETEKICGRDRLTFLKDFGLKYQLRVNRNEDGTIRNSEIVWRGHRWRYYEAAH